MPKIIKCHTEHVSPGFGVVPVGSLWQDDHPVVTAAPELFGVRRKPKSDEVESDLFDEGE